MVDRATSGAVMVTVGAAAALAGTFLPWLHSGARSRSSYDIFDLVERLGFGPDGVIAWSLRLWPLVPLVLVACAVSAWATVTGHLAWRWVAPATVAGMVWIGGTAGALFLAPDIGLFRVGPGPTVTLVGGAVLLAGVAAIRPRESGASAAS